MCLWALNLRTCNWCCSPCCLQWVPWWDASWLITPMPCCTGATWAVQGWLDLPVRWHQHGHCGWWGKKGPRNLLLWWLWKDMNRKCSVMYAGWASCKTGYHERWRIRSSIRGLAAAWWRQGWRAEADTSPSLLLQHYLEGLEQCWLGWLFPSNLRYSVILSLYCS